MSIARLEGTQRHVTYTLSGLDASKKYSVAPPSSLFPRPIKPCMLRIRTMITCVLMYNRVSYFRCIVGLD